MTEPRDRSSSPASPTRIRKHSLVIAGHSTSVSLEDAFWSALQDLAQREGMSLAALVAEIDASRGSANLSSAIRVRVLADLQERAPAEPEPDP